MPNRQKGVTDSLVTFRHDLYEIIRSRLLLKAEKDPNTRFALKDLAQEVLGEESLRRFYRCVSGTGGQTRFAIDETDFFVRVQEKRLEPFIVTLIFITAPIAAARAFVTSVIEPPDNNERLPLKKSRLEEIFHGDSATVDHFLANQHRFCTLVLFQEGTHMEIDDDDTARLPCMNERPIGEGAFGRVYEVKIPTSHLMVRTGGHILPGPQVVARKDYRRPSHAKDDFETERNFLKIILRSPSQCENVLSSYGTIEYVSSSAFSLFMPKADMDLEHYMREHESDNARPIASIAQHLQYAAGLARGIAYLHHGIESPDGRKVICRHLDLRPANVLIFHNDDGNMIWKISDFGLSRIKELPDGSISTGGLTVSPTSSPPGRGIYSAPESGSVKRMTTKSDLWSLGCIISVLCVWLRRGYDGVESYAKSRAEGDESACFYRNAKFGRLKPDPAVKTWHKLLIKEEKDIALKKALTHILEYLDDKTFSINTDERPTATELKSCLEKAANIAEQATPTQGASSVKSWPISFGVQADGCQFSLDKPLLAYYSKEGQIALYYESERFPENPGKPLIEPTPIYFHTAKIVDIGVHWYYMAIAEKDDSFCLTLDKFTLIKFIEASSNGPSFTRKASVRARLIPPIHLIAISPRGHWIACIVKGNISHPGRLYIVQLKKIKEATNVSDKLDETIWRYMDLPDWTSQNATNIFSLSFSSESSLWFAGKGMQEYAACVSRLEYSSDDKQPLTELGSAKLRKAKCIIATENIIIIHDFDKVQSPGIDKNIDEHFEIVKIIVSKDDRRILALVRPNNKHGILCLTELIAEGSRRRFNVRIIERFYAEYLQYSLGKIQLRWIEPEHSAGTQDAVVSKSRVLIAILTKPRENAVFEFEV
ncbi:hypothetical protein F5B22DRAFT_656618 [Xylaria bambusicola]|uniref:uncharacterized protein n=1 Tax=Xylaria bambusicola TaxID=326684 RepID=UPI0020081B7A|nr:uncharacterized protein F5B22DRAFT_656618 [Xylaria bambusicola]KAI0514630.1 hypothetical protein F5B22DRAFT_656618 [Xylaria bambusicola]